MEPMAIYWFVVAWLACWLVDLAYDCRARPLPFPTAIKLVIVVICLVMVLFLYVGGVPRLTLR